MAAVFEIPNPLCIVCTKCPAVATVRFQTHEHINDAVLVWVECHGVHRLGLVDTFVIRNVIEQDGDIPFNGIRQLDKEHVQAMLEYNERTSQQAAERAEFLQRFLKEAM